MKKQSAGFYLTVVSAVAAIVGLIAYLVNCNTNYFKNLGVDSTIVVCAVAAVLLQAVYVVTAQKGQKLWMDIIRVAVSVLLLVAALLFVNVRVNGIAAVMTFENNARNMADLTSAIVGIAGCLVAAIVSIVSAFFDVSKE